MVILFSLSVLSLLEVGRLGYFSGEDSVCDLSLYTITVQGALYNELLPVETEDCVRQPVCYNSGGITGIRPHSSLHDSAASKGLCYSQDERH